MDLIDLAKNDFAMISQWGIGKSGRGVNFFNHLKNGMYKHGQPNPDSHSTVTETNVYSKCQ